MGTGGGPTLPEPVAEPEPEPDVEPEPEPDVEPEPVPEPEPELPRETITLTLQVELEELSDENQEEIKQQITDLINDLGGTDLLFEPFESGSTVVKLSSTTPVSNDQLDNKINNPDDPMTITYTGENEEKKTTFFTKVGEQTIEYKNDIIIVKTDNTKQIGSVGEDGIVTRAIINDMIGASDDDRNLIQSVLFGGNCNSIEIGEVNHKNTQVFGHMSNLTSINFGPIQVIGEAAFSNCISLKSIDLSQVNTIGNFVFHQCNSLKTIDFKLVNEIGGRAFRYCTSITDLAFRDVQTINTYALT